MPCVTASQAEDAEEECVWRLRSYASLWRSLKQQRQLLWPAPLQDRDRGGAHVYWKRASRFDPVAALEFADCFSSSEKWPAYLEVARGGSSKTSLTWSSLSTTTTKLSRSPSFTRPPLMAFPAAAFSAIDTASDSSCLTNRNELMLSRSSISSSFRDHAV